MPLLKIKEIVLIGSGNVATNLALSFIEKGFIISQVYSRNIRNAKSLGKKIKAPFTNVISEINKTADLYILAITDSAVSELASQLPAGNSIIVHTSGTLDLNILNDFAHHGVFYPLQTFSKNKPIDFGNIPLLIEANTEETSETLKQLAALFSEKVYVVNSEQRKNIHLSAVFANNFTNYMYTIAEEILSHADVSFDILKPLINETALKIKEEQPCNVQTGPASRNDKETINNHLLLLNDFPDYKQIYSLLTNNIIKARIIN